MFQREFRDWVDYKSFERVFRNKYWSEEEQEALRSKIMGNSNFGVNGSNVTMYVMRLYNEVKYLEPPLPFQSFVRHLSKHLPQEIQITLMTREVADINELEQILDIFQNIRDGEMGRHPYTPVSHTNGNYNQSRDVYKRQPLHHSMKWYHKVAIEILLGSTLANAHIVYCQVSRKKNLITNLKIATLTYTQCCNVGQDSETNKALSTTEDNIKTWLLQERSSAREGHRYCCGFYGRKLCGEIEKNKVTIITTFCKALQNQGTAWNVSMRGANRTFILSKNKNKFIRCICILETSHLLLADQIFIS